jgi:hypothetical protein
VAVAVAVAQVGGFLLLRPLLHRLRAVTVLSRAAFAVLLTHQSVLLVLVIAVARVWPTAPGLLTAPSDPVWVLQRAEWLPVIALGLVAVVVLMRRWRPTRPAWPGAWNWRRRGTIPHVRMSGRPMEVIAVRDSDPPSRGRASRQPS